MSPGRRRHASHPLADDRLDSTHDPYTPDMAWRLRLWRRTKIAPGVTLNWSKSGPSISLGPRGAKTTISRRGIRRTIGVPGTGIYATHQETWQQLGSSGEQDHHPTEVPHSDTGSAPRPTSSMPKDDVTDRRCSFCGGHRGPDGRCSMCGQVAG